MNRNDALNYFTIQAQNENLSDITRAYYERAGDILVEGRSLKLSNRAANEEDAELLLECAAGLVDENDRWLWDMVGDDRMPYVGNYGFDLTTKAA